ncbi:hypothetical protein BYT27DRAFT_6436250 [Phlegmacium glaucopus]|nr:hypothetical protein BYT27DRAFT_6436250 [Phlegmacium glaucopus]
MPATSTHFLLLLPNFFCVGVSHGGGPKDFRSCCPAFFTYNPIDSTFSGLLLFLSKPKVAPPFLRVNHNVQASTSRNPVRNPLLLALTTYRTHMMLMVILAIIAVDFPVFLQSLAKFETFGVSLITMTSFP